MIVTRRIQCSTARLFKWAETRPHGEFVTGANGRLDMKSLLKLSSDRVHADCKVVDVEVETDTLSHLARELAMHTTMPLNRHRTAHYSFEVPAKRSEVEDISRDVIRTFGSEYFDRPHRVLFKWPCLQDEETGNQYYERCANLIWLTNALYSHKLKKSQVEMIVDNASRLDEEWSTAGILDDLHKQGVI